MILLKMKQELGGLLILKVLFGNNKFHKQWKISIQKINQKNGKKRKTKKLVELDIKK